jgi:hypothetical protein
MIIRTEKVSESPIAHSAFAVMFMLWLGEPRLEVEGFERGAWSRAFRVPNPAVASWRPDVIFEAVRQRYSTEAAFPALSTLRLLFMLQ